MALDDLWDPLLRAMVTIVLVVAALPVVAFVERFRGERTSTTTIGPRGARTAMATAIKLLQKRAPRPAGTDRALSSVAPVLLLIPTIGVLALLPMTKADEPGSTVPLVLALPLLATGALLLAGFGARHPLALLSALRLGTVRATALVVLALAVMGPLRAAGSGDMVALCRAQASVLQSRQHAGVWTNIDLGPLASLLPSWGAITAPLSFVAALLAFAVIAQQVQRARTDVTLTEPWTGDATGPVQLGYRVFESADLLASAGLISTIFFGGWHLPFVDVTAGVPGVLVSILKMGIALVLLVWVRNLLPKLSYSQALRVLWMVALPLAAVSVLAQLVLSQVMSP